jgi:hypothetical protein
MKKIIALILVSLAVSTSAFAAPGPLGTNTVSDQGTGIYGAAIPADAAIAVNPLVRMSTGVMGLVNFTATNNLVSTYVIATKHYKGSKVFATANDSTNIYWKASAAKTTAPFFVNTECTGETNAAAFPVGAGWTAY